MNSRQVVRWTFLAASLLMAQASQAASSLITFDDVAFSGGNPLAAVSPAVGYQGFDWGANWVISPNDATGWYGGTVQPYSHSGNNFAWIDRFTTGMQQFLVDDITVANIAAVARPATGAMLAAGLAMVAVVAACRRRRHPAT